MSNVEQAKPSLFFATEFAGAVLSNQCSRDASLFEQLQEDAKSTLFSTYNVNVGDIDVTTVQNTDSQVALVLPYYSLVEEISARPINENDIGEIAGGFEIIFSVFVTIGFGVTAAVIGKVSAGAISAVALGTLGAATAAGATTAGTVAVVGAGVGGAEAAKNK